MAHKKRGPRRKHVPQRTCIACRQVAGKRALIRLVRTESGIELDPSGKRAGRGAYLHPVRRCWEAVLGGGRLESALRIQLRPDNRAALLAYAAGLPADEASDADAVAIDEESTTGDAEETS